MLPGVQALFGFQLVAVFQTTFRKELSPLEARLHLAAIALAALSAALVIAPAAVHRRARPARVAPSLLRLASRLLTWSTWPLALAVFLDFGLLARLILGNGFLAGGSCDALARRIHRSLGASARRLRRSAGARRTVMVAIKPDRRDAG